MKQVLMDFVRCQGLSRKGKRCFYRARYGKFCGHHTSPQLQARYLFNAVMKKADKNRTLADDLPGSY